MKLLRVVWSNAAFLLIILISSPNISSASITAIISAALVVKDVINIVKDVTSTVSDVWSLVENNSASSNNKDMILSRFKDVSNEIRLTEKQNVEPVNSFINLQLAAKRIDITNAMNVIRTRFDEMKEYAIHHDNLENSTLLSFAEWTVSPNGFSVHHLMDRLHLTMFGSDDSFGSNIFQSLASSYGNEERCVNQQSAQQYVYSLYSDIALTELKAYTMMEFSFMILRAFGRGNFTQEALLKRKNYEKRTTKTLRLLREVMQKADRLVWRCDPQQHIEGKTYEQVTRFLQGYIENEVDMSPDRDCMQNCRSYGRAQNQGCYMDQFCARQERCTGQIHECKNAGYLKACPSSLDSLRRYEYLDFNSITAGKMGHCSRGESEVEAWTRYIFWDCSYCFCICDDQFSSKTDRYFNLRDTLSNVNENMVITGIRFTKINRIFHLQIQQGQLLPKGMINTTTLSWKPVDNYTLYERGVNNNQDYFTLTYDTRAIDLDEIQTDDQSLVLTGVRFRVLSDHLNLQARFSKFNFETGQLINPYENSFWKFHDISEYKRGVFDLRELDIPIRTTAKSLPVSSHNQYLLFGPASFKIDIYQTTVPFIDSQDVVSKPPVPLAGIGIYYKRNSGFGGFVAPKLITYDFVRHTHTT